MILRIVIISDEEKPNHALSVEFRKMRGDFIKKHKIIWEFDNTFKGDILLRLEDQNQ